jgi:hypothetical protein
MLVCQLPGAFRRLPRPSSPVIAKASTTCTLVLDPITLSPRGRPRRFQALGLLQRLCCSRCHRTLNDNRRYIQSKPSPHSATAGMPSEDPLAFYGPRAPRRIPATSFEWCDTSSKLLKNKQPLALKNQNQANVHSLGSSLFDFPSAGRRTNNPLHPCAFILAIGGGERDRTDDPLLAKQVLSQLSYTPV